MKIDSISTNSSTTSPAVKKNQSTANFSEYLAKSTVSKKKQRTPSVDMAAIRKKGLLKYVEDQKKEKIREKILKQRGLTEEKLSTMSPDEKIKIEKIISDEIQKRLAAESELDQGNTQMFALL